MKVIRVIIDCKTIKHKKADNSSAEIWRLCTYCMQMRQHALYQ